MAVAETDGERILVKTEFREAELIKLVPGIKWSPDEYVWWIPLTWAGCVQLRGVLGDNLKVASALNQWAAQEQETRVKPCLILRSAEDCTDPWMLTRLQQLGYYDAKG